MLSCASHPLPGGRPALAQARLPARRSRAQRALPSDTALAGELSVSPGSAPARCWELDFCSRPLLDARGKKVWELLVTDASSSLRYAEYFPNNRINSAELKAALQRLAEATAPPTSIRFFRAQMQTIIGRACTELGVSVLPSRRCFGVQSWLSERNARLYPTLPNFDAQAAPLVAFEPGAPAPLPDALRGESWAFVQLPLSAVRTEAQRVTQGLAFGAVFSPEAAGCQLPEEALVPGVVVLSRRADALAGWTNGLEIAALQPDTRAAQLLLETGVSQRWAYASWRRSAQASAEAEQWIAAKNAAQGLHFLCVSPNEQADASGFWLCREFDAKTL